MAAATYDFRERVAVVTGAAHGIGRGTAEALAAAGATTVCLDIDDARGEEVAAAARTAGGSAEYVHCDVTRSAAVTMAFAGLREQHGRLDQLVLSAGGFFRKIGFEESDDEEWRRILDLNLSSAFYCLRAAFPLLRENGAARVVCIGSLAGVTASHSSPAYGAAKAGVHELARMAALHLAPYGAAVNAIAPGTTHSARVDRLHGAEYMSQLEKTIPAGRLGEVEDIVAAILFYLSPEAAYTTGTTLNVSGGRFIS